MTDPSQLAANIEQHGEHSIDVLALSDRRSSPHAASLRCAARSRKMSYLTLS
jgi:hypothetical protein